MTAHDLLPQEYNDLDRALSLATDISPRVDPSITLMRGLKILSPPPSFLPYLIYEYGLGELTPYVPNLYELIHDGVRWQRVRGTPAAVAKALGWVGYEAEIEEFPTRRRHWNFFQLALDRVRDDEADLIRIEGVAGLSVCIRSVFWRGFSGYDVRALEYSRGSWGNKLWGSYSGVRLPPGQAKWSFGRRHEIDHAMTQAELEALGVWIEPTTQALSWGPFPWPHVPWADAATNGRSVAMLEAAWALWAGKPAWAVFYDASDNVIGYRRARAFHMVGLAEAAFMPLRALRLRAASATAAGQYRMGETGYSVQAAGATKVYVEAMTDFGEGYESRATKVGFVLGVNPADDRPPGALWLPPGGLAEDPPVLALTPIEIPFGRTVRERVCALLRF